MQTLSSPAQLSPALKNMSINQSATMSSGRYCELAIFQVFLSGEQLENPGLTKQSKFLSFYGNIRHVRNYDIMDSRQ